MSRHQGSACRCTLRAGVTNAIMSSVLGTELGGPCSDVANTLATGLIPQRSHKAVFPNCSKPRLASNVQSSFLACKSPHGGIPGLCHQCLCVHILLSFKGILGMLSSPWHLCPEATSSVLWSPDFHNVFSVSWADRRELLSLIPSTQELTAQDRVFTKLNGAGT